ncbi:MAG: acyl-CoA dehydrogenase [Deltaproteobacteria bacterium]|nr:acyl-CoA dehydrogenase [Deltaproteobacteria bacterium]
MDFGLHEDDAAAAQLARGILADHATNERQKQLEASGATHDEALWRVLADASVLGVAIPEEHGGAGLGFLALGLLLQEVGRAVAKIPAYPALVLGALPLVRFGSAAQQEALLPGLARGEQIVTAALCEYASSDPLAPVTRAARDRDGYRLDGVKTLVPAAQIASHVIVPARCDDGSIALFLIESTARGVTLAEQATSDGQPHAELTFDGVRADDACRLAHGQPATGGAEALRWIVERAVVARCMVQLGVIERALEMTAQYGRERIQFDRPIGSFQAFHQRAADAYVNVAAIRLTAWEAAWHLADEQPASHHVAVAKFWAAEGGQLASYACQHLHGGIGIDVDYPLHRYFRWAIQIEHELGSAKHHLERLGRSIAEHGLPAA